ncbi:MAG: SGNH/GDSL hydrolase family protein [Cyanobacteria bacterium J06621_11]
MPAPRLVAHALRYAASAIAPSAAILGFLLPLLPSASAIAQTTTQPHPKTYSSLNIFGDSLVDTGNLFNLTGFPPSPPYAQKLSNDTLWIEPFADALNLSPVLSSEVLPGLLSGTAPPPTEGINFGLAGSLTSDLSTVPPLPGLQQQIETFEAIAPILPTDENSLFVLVAGANDYNEAIFNPSTNTSPASLINQVTDNLTNAASSLINSGAKNLFISNLPDLGLQPFADLLDQFNPQGSSLLTAFSDQHNQLLDQKLTALSLATNTKITQLNVNKIINDVANDPASFGFTNTEDACLTNFQPGFVFDGICDNPDEFLFWDDVHPTAATHDIIAQFALTTLNKANQKEGQKIPEPSIIFALLAVGSLTLFQPKKPQIKVPQLSSTKP